MEIQSTNQKYPLGRIVERYAQMKWWTGFYTGWISGISYCSILYLWFSYRK
jgi:hypothetical protein